MEERLRDGQIDKWKKDLEMDRQIDGRKTQRWIDRQMEERLRDGQIDKWKKDLEMDRQINGRKTQRWIDRQMNGQWSGKNYRQIDRRMDVQQIYILDRTSENRK